MLLQITHETQYQYTPAVETAQHMAYLQPNSHAGQNLLSHSLHIDPMPAQQRTQADVYGNARCFFSLPVPHDTLTVVARSMVATRTREQASSSLSWEQVKARFLYRADGVHDAASEFVFASRYVPKHPEFAAFANSCFTAQRNILDAVIALMHRIHTEFQYASNSTQISTPALDALAQRKGVCQDFAHIMLACLRTIGLPARYVSGYLLTQAAPGMDKLIGSDASHAWVSVYIPDLPDGARWCDLDPTNARWGWHAPGEDYVTVATGRDFGDVSPLRGVIHGGARHTLNVGVTVEALATDSAEGASLPCFPGQTQTQLAWEAPEAFVQLQSL